MKALKFVFLASALILVAFALSACGTPNTLAGTPLPATGKVYGFINGWWDGATIGWSFIMMLFGRAYGLYQAHNSGLGYDFGYILGLGSAYATIQGTKFTITRK